MDPMLKLVWGPPWHPATRYTKDLGAFTHGPDEHKIVIKVRAVRTLSPSYALAKTSWY